MKFPSLGLNGSMKLGTGLALGAAIILLAPVIVPVVSGVVRSLAKAGIKGGILLYEKGKVMAEEAKESLEDVVAEARTELTEESQVAPNKKTSSAAPK